ncbi:MAG: hypothetical protein WBL28_05810 [Methylotenera sp.]
MADVTQLSFTHKEVIEALLLKQKINEGCWSLSINFGFGAITGGPSAEEAHPAAVVAVTGIGITKVEPGTPGIYIDASTLTPKPTKPRSDKKTSPSITIIR